MEPIRKEKKKATKKLMKKKRRKWDGTDELQLAGIGEDGTKPGNLSMVHRLHLGAWAFDLRHRNHKAVDSRVILRSLLAFSAVIIGWRRLKCERAVKTMLNVCKSRTQITLCHAKGRSSLFSVRQSGIWVRDYNVCLKFTGFVSHRVFPSVQNFKTQNVPFSFAVVNIWLSVYRVYIARIFIKTNTVQVAPGSGSLWKMKGAVCQTIPRHCGINIRKYMKSVVGVVSSRWGL